MINLLRIKEIANKKNISLNEIADFVGITPTTLSKIMRENSTKTSTLEKIALKLKVPVSTFFDNVLEEELQIANETQAEYKKNGKEPPECKECLSLKKELAYKDKRIEDLEEMVKILKQANADLRMKASSTDNITKKNAS